MLRWAAALMLLVMSGCAARYEPVDIGIPATGGEFFPVLMRHLADARGYAFALGFQKGEYAALGARSTADGSKRVYLLRSLTVESLPLAYVYFDFGPDARVSLGRNVSVGARMTGASDDGDGVYQGTYRIYIADARFCVGETKDLPVVQGNEITLKQYDRIMRRSMYDRMTAHYTPTFCQGRDRVPGLPELEGVRFYFMDEEAMAAFAVAFMAEFPVLGILIPELPSPPLP